MTLTDEAYEKIRSDIIAGRFPAGEPLRLDMLKARYGFGNSPIREALNRLQSERLVDAAALKGFRVSPLSQKHLWDTIETRIVLETRALKLSIKNGGDDWETGIVASLHAFSLQIGRLEGNKDASSEEIRVLEERHWAFHHALICASGSAWLPDLCEQLYAATERYRYAFHEAITKQTSAPDPLEEHQVLADAAIARDSDRAVALLDSHLRITGEQIELLNASKNVFSEVYAPK